MNVVVVRGRLVRDPESRTTQEGKSVGTFTLAVDRPDHKSADFIPVVVWEKLAENCCAHLVKAQEATVNGRLQIRSYDGKDGTKRTVAEVIGREVDFGSKPNRQEQPTQAPITDAGQFGQDVTPEDEIPF